MKNLKLVFFFLFFSFVSVGQPLNLEYIFSKNSFTNLPLIEQHNDKVFLAGSDFKCMAGLVVGMSDTSVLFRTYPESGGYWKVTDINWDEASNQLIGCGFWSIADDYGTNETDGVYVFGLDENGNVLFENKLTIEIYPTLIDYFASAPQLATTTNGDFVVSAGNGNLLWFDGAGILFNSQSLVADENIHGVEYVNDSILLAYTETDIYLFDHSGNLLETIEGNSLIHDLFIDDEKIYLLTEVDLLVYVIADGTSTSVNSFFDHIEEPTGISGNENSLFVYQRGYNSEGKYIQLDKTDFSLLTENIFDQPNCGLFTIIAMEDSLYIVGSQDMYTRQAFIKTVPIENTVEFGGYDIALTDIRVDSLVLSKL